MDAATVRVVHENRSSKLRTLTVLGVGVYIGYKLSQIPAQIEPSTYTTATIIDEEQ